MAVVLIRLLLSDGHCKAIYSGFDSQSRQHDFATYGPNTTDLLPSLATL